MCIRDSDKATHRTLTKSSYDSPIFTSKEQIDALTKIFHVTLCQRRHINFKHSLYNINIFYIWNFILKKFKNQTCITCFLLGSSLTIIEIVSSEDLPWSSQTLRLKIYWPGTKLTKNKILSWLEFPTIEWKNFKFSGHFDSWDTSPKVKWSRCNVFLQLSKFNDFFQIFQNITIQKIWIFKI